MVCKNCNRILPEGTSFCVYCGTPVAQNASAEQSTVIAPEGTHTAPYTVPVGMTEEAYVASMGGVPTEPAAVPYTVPAEPAAEPIEIPPIVPAEPVPLAVPVNAPQVPASRSSGTSSFMKRFQPFGLILAGVLAVLAVALLIWGVSLNGKLSEEKELRQAASVRYENEIDDLKDTIGQLNQAIDDKDAAIAEMQGVTDAYYNMYDALRTHNIGSATYNFQATDDFIVVRKSNTGYKFTLTAHWRDGGTVSVDYSSPCATVSFDKETWVKTVQVTVIPKEVGFTVATFSNSVDANTFSILILVVE